MGKICAWSSTRPKQRVATPSRPDSEPSVVAWVNKKSAGDLSAGAQLRAERLAPSQTRRLGGGHDNESPRKALRCKTRVGKGGGHGLG